VTIYLAGFKFVLAFNRVLEHLAMNTPGAVVVMDDAVGPFNDGHS